MSRGRLDRMAIALAQWSPIRLIGELGPERLLLNFAFALMGLGALLEQPAGLLALWPRWFGIEWALALLVGGISALWGIVRGGTARTTEQRQRARLAEWIGYVCVGAAAAVYGFAVLFEFGLTSLRVGLLFLAIALAKGIRLLLSYAARSAYLQHADPDNGPATP